MGAKDITEKILADYNDVFADIVNGVLFDGEQVVSEHALRNVKDKSQYKFDNRIHEQERDVAKNLHECMKIPKKLKPYVNDYKINLVEVAFLDDKLDYFHSDFRIIAEFFINRRKNADYVPSAQTIKHVDEFLKLLQALTGDQKYHEILETLQENEKKEGITMCEVLARAENKGIAKINKLNSILLEQNRIDDLKRAVHDAAYQKQLMEQYGIGVQEPEKHL